MALSSVLPSLAPVPVPYASARGPIAQPSGSETRARSESVSPETPRAPDAATEARNGRGPDNAPRSGSSRAGQDAGQGLDEQQLKQLQELKARDREVRTHEQAHQAAGGQYAGAASYTYQRGPDGNQYAVGGEVSIDISPVSGDPQATIEKMRKVRAAAMAPAQPSAQDRTVAAQAMQLMLQAQVELNSEQGAGATEIEDRDSGRSEGISASKAYRDISGMVDPDAEHNIFRAVA